MPSFWFRKLAGLYQSAQSVGKGKRWRCPDRIHAETPTKRNDVDLFRFECAARYQAASGPVGPRLLQIYRALRKHFGHAAWWPGDTPLEVAVGAVLTQNTSWRNVERAILALKRAGLLSLPALAAISEDALAHHLQSAGTFRVKARRLKNLVAWISRECAGDFDSLRHRPLAEVRASLLAVNGVGEETADAILLYATPHTTFVVDAYTRRAFARLGFLRTDATYAEAKRVFESALPADRELFNDYHAQIVRLGQATCRTKPRCAVCPLAARFVFEAKRNR
mgnify:CR=1 FL=1